MSEFRERISGPDRLDALHALRDQVAWKLDAGECRTCGGPRGEAAGLAALALRLMAIFEAIDSLPVAGEVTELDDLADYRTRRRTGTADPSLPAADSSGGF